MTPRPFYRSRLFWLGLPGLVFLLWAWGNSWGRISHAGFWGPRSLGLALTGGELFAIWDTAGMPNWRSFDIHHDKVPVEVALQWKAGLEEGLDLSLSVRYVVIPCYGFVATYLLGWLLTLAWWQRRKSRLVKLHTAP